MYTHPITLFISTLPIIIIIITIIKFVTLSITYYRLATDIIDADAHTNTHTSTILMFYLFYELLIFLNCYHRERIFADSVCVCVCGDGRRRSKAEIDVDKTETLRSVISINITFDGQFDKEEMVTRHRHGQQYA